jgi:hypothetical protein
MSVRREPDVIGAGDLESFAARTLDAEAAISLGEMEQNGALRDLEGAEYWALVGGSQSVVLGKRAGWVRVLRRRRLLCGERRE